MRRLRALFTSQRVGAVAGVVSASVAVATIAGVATGRIHIDLDTGDDHDDPTVTVTVPGRTRTVTTTTPEVSPEAMALSDVLEDLEDPTTTDVDLDFKPAKIGAQSFEEAVTAEIYSPLVTPSEAVLEVPVAGYSRFEAETGFAPRSSSVTAATLLVYRDKARGLPIEELQYDGPADMHGLDLGIAGVTTLIFVWKPFAGAEELVNGSEFVFGDGYLSP